MCVCLFIYTDMCVRYILCTYTFMSIVPSIDH